MSVDALVTDAHERSAVWALRGLGRAGLRLAALGPDRMAAGTVVPALSRARGRARTS